MTRKSQPIQGGWGFVNIGLSGTLRVTMRGGSAFSAFKAFCSLFTASVQYKRNWDLTQFLQQDPYIFKFHITHLSYLVRTSRTCHQSIFYDVSNFAIYYQDQHRWYRCKSVNWTLRDTTSCSCPLSSNSIDQNSI